MFCMYTEIGFRECANAIKKIEHFVNKNRNFAKHPIQSLLDETSEAHGLDPAI